MLNENKQTVFIFFQNTNQLFQAFSSAKFETIAYKHFKKT